MIRFFIILFLVFAVAAQPVAAQQKNNKKGTSTGSKSTQKKPAAKTTKQPAKATGKTTPGPGSAEVRLKPGSIDASKIDTFKLQVIPLVKFFESTLNFIADPRNEVNEKQTILSKSYLKWCWDNKVQIEDDLDENRLVPLYKDMPAYLTDVGFFFKNAKFSYTVQDVRVESGQDGLTYFLVTANRNLRAITLNNDSVNSNKVRYLEMNFDSVKQQMMIVSVYTTKLNEKDDMRNWWNNLTPVWKTILAGEMKLEGTMPMSGIDHFNDSLAIINGMPTPIMGSEFYRYLGQIIRSEKVDLSGNTDITSLEPLNKMSELREVNLSGTKVGDLMPLRNLNKMRVLDISNTVVSDLSPLRFCLNIEALRLKDTPVQDLSVIPSFQGLTLLDITGTKVSSLDTLRENTAIRDLRIGHTSINDLSPVSAFVNLEMLNISTTPVDQLTALKDLTKLLVLICDSTQVASLEPLEKSTDLQRVYCNNSRIGQKEAMRFLALHPNASVIYESKGLSDWWTKMDSEWHKVFSFYRNLSDPPTTEQLHQLALLDSINITGRMSLTSLTPLEMLPFLRVIYCQSTGITSLEPLKSLTGLKEVNASNTKVAGLDPLSALTDLETLNIDNTKVADLSPLYGLKNLKLVLADFTPLEGKDADKFHDQNPECLLVYQSGENTTWWEGLNSEWRKVLLQQLSLKADPDKLQLQQLASLTKVTIVEDSKISDLSPLVYLRWLTALHFSGNTVSKLDPVARMTNLKVLVCTRNPIQDLTPIALNPKLTELDFSNTQVEDLDALQNMTKLEVLKFSGTQVKNLKYLQQLVNLRVLEFYNTRVGSIDALEGMNKLELVKMFNTKVSAKRVEKLKELHPKCEIVYY